MAKTAKKGATIPPSYTTPNLSPSRHPVRSSRSEVMPVRLRSRGCSTAKSIRECGTRVSLSPRNPLAGYQTCGLVSRQIRVCSLRSQCRFRTKTMETNQTRIRVGPRRGNSQRIIPHQRHVGSASRHPEVKRWDKPAQQHHNALHRMP